MQHGWAGRRKWPNWQLLLPYQSPSINPTTFRRHLVQKTLLWVLVQLHFELCGSIFLHRTRDLCICRVLCWHDVGSGFICFAAPITLGGTPGQWRGLLPSPVWTQHRAVKGGQSGGSVGTTYQEKLRVSGEVRIGQTARGRAQCGERLLGEMVQGKGRGKWREANRHRQQQTAMQPGVTPTPPPHNPRNFLGEDPFLSFRPPCAEESASK